MIFDARMHGLNPYQDGDTNRRLFSNLIRYATPGSTVVIPAGRYTITGELALNGAKAAKIVGEPGAVFVLRSDGKQRSQITCTMDMNGLVIENLHIDASGVPSDAPVTAVFYGAGASNITLRECTITDVPTGAGIQFTALDRDGEVRLPFGVVVDRCTVSGRGMDNKPRTELISITGLTAQRKLGKTPNQYWTEHHSTLPVVRYAHNIRVSNCSLHGGYYGVGLSAVASSQIVGNTIVDVMRGVSVQNDSAYNVISSNLVVDNVSAGIHLAYGAHNNVVQGNHVESSVARGEGMLQAYVGCRDNLFASNRTICHGATGAKYHCYTAVGSSRNTFRDNDIEGACSRAYIAVESEWDMNWANPRHRAMGTAKDTMMAGNLATTAALLDNVVTPTSAVPCLFFSAAGAASIDVEGSGSTVFTKAPSIMQEVALHGSGAVQLTSRRS